MEFWHIFGSFQRESFTVGRMDINWPSLLIICNGWLNHSISFQVINHHIGYSMKSTVHIKYCCISKNREKMTLAVRFQFLLPWAFNNRDAFQALFWQKILPVITAYNCDGRIWAFYSTYLTHEYYHYTCTYLIMFRPFTTVKVVFINLPIIAC